MTSRASQIDLHAHIHSLAAHLDVVVFVQKYGDPMPWRGWAWGWQKGTLPGVVMLAPLDDGRDLYRVALHELGHHAQGHFTGRRVPTLDAETQAWEWAFQHSLVRWRKSDWRDVLTCLNDYASDRRRKRSPEFLAFYATVCGRAA